MRHLFVPACLCLATLSVPLGSDSKLSPTDFSSASIVKEKASVDASPGDSGESTHDKDRPSDTAELSMFSPEDGEPAELLQAPPLPPVPKPVVHRSRDEICDTLTQAAQSNDVPAPFFIRLLFQESGFRPGVVSPAGAEGIAQFMPETAASMGLNNPFDPLPAIQASARLLRDLMQHFGNLGLAAAAYNAGPRRIEDWLAKKGKLPHETQGYVKSITGREAKNWIVAAAGSPALKLPQRAPCQEAAGLLAWNGPARIPLPPIRTPAAPAGKTMVATRAQVKIVHATAAKPTVQLAAAQQKHRKLQLSQR